MSMWVRPMRVAIMESGSYAIPRIPQTVGVSGKDIGPQGARSKDELELGAWDRQRQSYIIEFTSSARFIHLTVVRTG